MADWYKIPGAARELDVSEKTMRRHVVNGDVPSRYEGGAYWIAAETLQELAELKSSGEQDRDGRARLDWNARERARNSIRNLFYGRRRNYQMTAELVGTACERLESRLESDEITAEDKQDLDDIATGLAWSAEEAMKAELRDLRERYGEEPDLMARSWLRPVLERCVAVKLRAMSLSPQTTEGAEEIREHMERLTREIA